VITASATGGHVGATTVAGEKEGSTVFPGVAATGRPGR
jgi:hypothetical protein